MGVVIGVLVAIVVVGAVGLVLYRRRETDPAVLAARQWVRECQAQLKAAENTRNSALKAAQAEVDSISRARDKRIKALRQQIAALNEPKGRRVASYHGVTLHELWISTPHGSGSVAGVNASVDAQPSSRITATRLVALGVFALAAKKKTGAVYLSIDGPDFASVVECPQTENTKAREFAVKIMNASRSATAAAAARPQQLAAATSELSQAQGTDELDAARLRLDAVAADDSLSAPIRAAEARVRQAQTQLAALQSPA